MFVAFECLYCHLWISASSSGISVPSKKENCLHATETWLVGIGAQSNKRILIAISFAFSYGRRITLDWRGGEHLAEKWHKWQTVAEGSVKWTTLASVPSSEPQALLAAESRSCLPHLCWLLKWSLMLIKLPLNGGRGCVLIFSSVGWWFWSGSVLQPLKIVSFHLCLCK